MKRDKQKDRIIIGLALFLLFLAVIYQHLAAKQDTLTVLQQGEPAVEKYERLNGNYPSYKLWDAEDSFLGYGVVAHASGYGGKLVVLSIIEESGRVKNVTLLENAETPLYLNKVLDSGLLDKITAKDITQGFEAQGFEDIDGVSGATVTTEAIIAAVQKGTAQIGNEQLGLNIPVNAKLNLIWQDIVAIILVLLAIVCSALNARKLRPWLLLMSVIFIGFILNYSLTYSNYVSILAGRLPVFTERPIWYIMVPGILTVTLLWGRNFYCSWLCPFGAVQEGIYRSLNLFRFSPSSQIRAKVKRFRWPLLWLVAMLALVFNNSGIASFEPFSVFFDGSGNTDQWIIMLIVLLMSIALLRFWCYSFCPVGAILDLAARLNLKKKLIKNKKQERGQEYELEQEMEQEQGQVQAQAQEQAQEQEQGRMDGNTSQCSACAACKTTLSKQDKLYIFIVSLVNILIIFSLLESSGLIYS